jgi:hypothetical protein
MKWKCRRSDYGIFEDIGSAIVIWTEENYESLEVK